MRLTNHDPGYQPWVISANKPTWRAIYDKLCAYEDAEEHGLLVRLPCKVGDTLFVPSQGAILNGTVDEIRVCKRDVYVFSKHDSANWVFTPVNFGKTVFLSRAEAEAAMKGEREDV